MAREWCTLSSGALSKTISYKVLVSSPVGLQELDRLIEKLQIDRQILAEDEAEPTPDTPE